MAQQTSAIQRKEATPPSIGRLMDVDFFLGSFFLFLVVYESSVMNNCSSRKPTQGPLIKGGRTSAGSAAAITTENQPLVHNLARREALSLGTSPRSGHNGVFWPDDERFRDR